MSTFGLSFVGRFVLFRRFHCITQKLESTDALYSSWLRESEAKAKKLKFTQQ